MKKPVLVFALLLTLISSVAFASVTVFAKPRQTKQGCQTEAADYLVDVIWVEFGPGIYDLSEDELIEMLQGMGANDAAIAAFVPLILNDMSIIGYFGPCCFEGGHKKYVDARNNNFPTSCCKPPDFGEFPLPPYLGSGDGNPCLCQSGLHKTPEGRRYGNIGDYFVPPGPPLALEEWVAIYVGPPP
jgi:hypothetical protein